MAYVVDTQAGYNGLNSLYSGSGSFQATDGSVWRLGNDGSPYATMPNGSVLPIVKDLDQITSYAAKAAAQSAGSNNLSAATYDRYLKELKASAGENTQQSIKLAQMQNEWQEVQNAKAMSFNADQAAVNRQWQEYMSNTAHQREVRDLIAAGLNPVLSVTGGQGAAVGSGAQASGVTSSGARGEVDRSFSAAMGNMLGTLINSATQITQSNINAQTQRDVERMKEAHDIFIREAFPNSFIGGLGALFESLVDGSAFTRTGKAVSNTLGYIEDAIEGIINTIKHPGSSGAPKRLNKDGSGKGYPGL